MLLLKEQSQNSHMCYLTLVLLGGLPPSILQYHMIEMDAYLGVANMLCQKNQCPHQLS